MNLNSPDNITERINDTAGADTSSDEPSNSTQSFGQGKPWQFWALFPALMVTVMLSAAEVTGESNHAHPASALLEMEWMLTLNNSHSCFHRHADDSACL